MNICPQLWSISGFFISSQIKQVKRLEMHLSVAATCGNVFCEFTCGQRSVQLKKKKRLQ